VKTVLRKSNLVWAHGTAALLMLVLLLPTGCQSSGAGGTSGNPPQAAIDACLHNADAYQNAKPGTATFDGNARADVAVDNPAAAGSNWWLQVTVAGVAMGCTVAPDGTVRSLKPL
jgi:hypothetical protein